MAYAADYTLATSAGFQSQVQGAAVKAALAIVNEAMTAHTQVDIKRHALATQVLNNWTSALALQFAFAVIEAGALITGATDAQIDAQMSAVWNGLAGVSNADTLGR